MFVFSGVRLCESPQRILDAVIIQGDRDAGYSGCDKTATHPLLELVYRVFGHLALCCIDLTNVATSESYFFRGRAWVHPPIQRLWAHSYATVCWVLLGAHGFHSFESLNVTGCSYERSKVSSNPCGRS